MNISHVCRPVIALVAMAFVVLSSGCAVTGGGYGYDGGGGVGLDYYEPYGSYYGGWGSTFFVGPGRGGDHRFDRREDHGHAPTQHAFRSAPASHSAPSIPSRSHSSRPRGH